MMLRIRYKKDFVISWVSRRGTPAAFSSTSVNMAVLLMIVDETGI